jgi:hypothetical protein
VTVRSLAAEEFDGVDIAMFDVPDESTAPWPSTTRARSGWIRTCPSSCRRSTRPMP